ncbi:MAG: bifunctional (p)ppGpp synthetase/guanosine-3',5'-bis(diphosphate) 3'-pyrophosphohydrolase, partial [Clostridia bacterium]|nr:bifunctional (p)ppGpp synthetase/guanosine-3',5'-bis(diphosphate) 3'-pyrophosphohydrolase [Clostridia bacterium]
MLSPDQSFELLKERIIKYNPQADLSIVEKAYSLSVVAHQGQQRISGEPYVTHPLAVANILAEMELDCGSIAAGLLHDTVEDTDLSIETIMQDFGTDIALLVDGVTKLGKVPLSTKEEVQA